MTTTYRLDVYDLTGALRYVVTDFFALSYTRKVNFPGLLQFSVKGDHPLLANIEDKWQIEVWRKLDGEDWYRDFVGLYRQGEWYYGEKGTKAVITCPGIASILSWRIVAYRATLTNRSEFHSKPAETIMKTIVEYNATAAAVSNGNLGLEKGEEVYDSTESVIRSLCEFDGYLYAGSADGAKIFRSADGTTWTEIEDLAETYVFDLCEFDGYLYAGTGDNGKIYRSSDGLIWAEVYDSTEDRVYALCVFDGYIYAACSGAGKIFRSSNGTVWNEMYDADDTLLCSLCVFDGYIYAGSGTLGKIYRSANGTVWTEVEDTTETYIWCMCVFEGYLYAGTIPNGYILRSANGTDWTTAYDTAYIQILSMVVCHEQLYAGVGDVDGLVIRSTDGLNWDEVYDTIQTTVYSLGVFGNYLYAGTGNLGKIYRVYPVARIRDGEIPGLSIEVDGENGNVIDWFCAWDVILESLQDLARVAGGDFDLVKTSATTWSFRWYTGQLGTDRSATVLFAMERGNMAEPEYKELRMGEKTAAIIGGQGTELERTVATETGANYAVDNDLEVFINAVDVSTADGLSSRGDKALSEQEAVISFNFKILQTPATLYGKHYFLGDLISALNPFTSVIATYKVDEVQITLEETGKETVDVKVK